MRKVGHPQRRRDWALHRPRFETLLELRRPPRHSFPGFRTSLERKVAARQQKAVEAAVQAKEALLARQAQGSQATKDAEAAAPRFLPGKAPEKGQARAQKALFGRRC